MECQGIDNAPLLHPAATLGASEEGVALPQQVKPAVYKDFQESAWSCTINKKLLPREFHSSSQLVFNLSAKNIHTQPMFLLSQLSFTVIKILSQPEELYIFIFGLRETGTQGCCVSPGKEFSYVCLGFPPDSWPASFVAWCPHCVHTLP